MLRTHSKLSAFVIGLAIIGQTLSPSFAAETPSPQRAKVSSGSTAGATANKQAMRARGGVFTTTNIMSVAALAAIAAVAIQTATDNDKFDDKNPTPSTTTTTSSSTGTSTN